MARSIAAKANNWDEKDTVLLIGGLAEEIRPYIIKYYIKAETLYPQVQYSDGLKHVHPVYANCVGFYRIARSLYE